MKEANRIETWQGVNLADNSKVVIKTAKLANISPSSWLRLQHEAQVLSHMKHPNLCAPLDFYLENSQVHLVLPFLEGVTLDVYLKEKKSLSILQSIKMAQDIFKALDFAHLQDVLHRDVKPGNVMIQEAQKGVNCEVQAILIDFGLARSNRLDSSVGDEIVGSVLYMSPEQAGLLRREINESSDLYSAGVLLFECLSGRTPYLALTVGEALRQHLGGEVPTLRSLGVAVPRVLEELVQRLLRKDPFERYQSASAVLEDLGQIRDALERGESEPHFTIGLKDYRVALTEPGFIGREKELQILEDELSAAEAGQAKMILLDGESGGGKSRLLEELTLRAKIHEIWVLRAYGLDQVAQRPFQMWSGMTAQLIHVGERDPEFVRAFRHALSSWSEALCRALPELSVLFGDQLSREQSPEDYGQTRSIHAFLALLDFLASLENRSVLIVLDDVQWADEMTMKLLRAWDQQAEHGKLTIIASVISRDIEPEHFLRSSKKIKKVLLANLTSKDIRELIQSMTGALPDEALLTIERLSQGSPFMATAILRGLIESNALILDWVDSTRVWTVDPIALVKVQSSRHAGLLLARRLELLPKDALRLLSIGAVIGREFEIELVSNLSGLEASAVSRALTDVQRRQMIWLSPNESHGQFIHDKIREVLLEKISYEEKSVWHLHLAEYFIRQYEEKKSEQKSFEIAYHLDAAGFSNRALLYAMQAAEQARSRFAFELAEQQYQIALRGLSLESDNALRLTIFEGLANTYVFRAKYADAKKYFEASLALAQSSLARAQIQGKLGDLALKKGDVAEAADALDAALGFLGQVPPKAKAKVFFKMFKEIIVQVFHTYFSHFFLHRRLISSERDLLIVRLYSRLAYAYWYRYGTLHSVWAHLREMNIAELYLPSAELGQAYSNHCIMMTTTSKFVRGERYALRGEEIRRKLGDTWGEGQSLAFYGALLYVSAQFEKCLQVSMRAEQILFHIGDAWEANNASWHVFASHYRLGNLNQAVIQAKKLYFRAKAIGERHHCGVAFEIWAKASLGQVPEEVVKEEIRLVQKTDAQTYVEVLQGQALFFIRQKKYSEAVLALKEAQETARKNWIRTEYVAAVDAWLASALRLQWESTAPRNIAQKNLLQKNLRQVVQRALKISKNFPNGLPHAYREAGFLAQIEGQMMKAKKYFGLSLDIAKKHGAKYEWAQTRIALAELAVSENEPGAQEDLERYLRECQNLQPLIEKDKVTSKNNEEASISLIDRFGKILESGRTIATALRKEDVYKAIRKASVDLLRAEQCLILDVDQTQPESAKEPWKVLLDDKIHKNFSYSKSLVEEVMRSGKPKAIGPLELEPQQTVFSSESFLKDSFVLSKDKSAVCAPIYNREKIVSCLYLSHQSVYDLFGQDEEQIAQFIVILAGAALENVDGFAQIQEFSDTLEQRIEERTKELQTAQMQLIQSAKMSALGEMAGGIAHEINTPLAIILLLADQITLTLEDQNSSDPHLLKNIKKMSKTIERIAKIITGLRAFSREGALDPMERVSIQALIEETLVFCREKFRGAGIEIQGIQSLPDLFIECRSVQISQVLLNLLNNAFDASLHLPEKWISIQVVTWELDIDIHIQDSGHGIDSSVRNKIFQPFFSTKEVGQGTGLGLSISKGIIEAHGGSLDLNDKSEHTEFVIRLPKSHGAES